MTTATADKPSAEQGGGVSAGLGEMIAKIEGVRDRVKAGTGERLRVKNSAHRSASRKRSNEDWMPALRSPDQDLLPEQRTMVARSRDAVRNHAVASGALETIIANVIRDGIRPRSHIDFTLAGIAQEQARTFEKEINRQFKLWSPYADVQRRMNFFGVQELVERSLVIAGEALVVRRWKPSRRNPVGLCVDVIETDRLSDPRGGTPTTDGRVPEIVSGVEIDQDGAPLAYWVEKAVRGTRNKGTGSWVRIPANDPNGSWRVKHLYKQMRPGQTRGVPFLSPILDYLHNIDDYVDAHLVAARAGACASMWIKTTSGGYEGATTNADGEDEDGNLIETTQAGTVNYLDEGEEPVAYEPKFPSEVFGPFVTTIISLCGAGVGLPPQIIMSNFEKMNFSQMRGALVEAGYVYTARQSFQIENLQEWMWRELIWELVEQELLVLPGFWDNPDAYCGARWMRPGREAIDPTKEAQANTIGIQNQTVTRTQVVASTGRSIEEHFAELREEQDEAKSQGIELSTGKKDGGEVTKEAVDGMNDPDEADKKETETANAN